MTQDDTFRTLKRVSKSDIIEYVKIWAASSWVRFDHDEFVVLLHSHGWTEIEYNNIYRYIPHDFTSGLI
jgi:hypothetical protein